MDLQSLITLEQQKQLMECSASSCMAEIGGAMGAQFVVVSSVGKGSSFLLAATLVDTRTAQTVNSVTESVPGVDEGALPQAIPRVVYRLLQKGGLLRPGVADPGAGAARPDNAVAPPAAPPAVAPRRLRWFRDRPPLRRQPRRSLRLLRKNPAAPARGAPRSLACRPFLRGCSAPWAG